VSYSLFVAATADRQLGKLTRAVQARLDPAIDALADDPRPHGSRKMQGTKSSYRIRVGDYRVIYAVDDQARRVDVLTVAHRRESYR
jgi:mRNA interferase RelE/StbE